MKHKSLKIIFAFLTVVVVLVSFSLTIFASDQPSTFSLGYSYDSQIYSGNTDVLITFNILDPSSHFTFNFATSINPLISYDIVEEDAEIISSYQFENDLIANSIIECTFSSFESTPNYSDFLSDSSWFGSNFALVPMSDNSDYLVTALTVSASDFYFYLDPNGDLYDPDFGGTFAESFIEMSGNYNYNYGAQGTIYYCLAGQEYSEDTAQFYQYSLDVSETTSNLFSTLPSDQSFSETYSEPTLIYVEYFELLIPVDAVSFDGIYVDGYYYNYNMNYRNLDISSGVGPIDPSDPSDPISPINPGIFRDYTSWIGTAVGGFLDLQLVDGFTLGGILMTLIAFMIALWFLKVFAGG